MTVVYIFDKSKPYDKDNYPTLDLSKEKNRELLAWQFLRRNKEYIDFFEFFNPNKEKDFFTVNDFYASLRTESGVTSDNKVILKYDQKKHPHVDNFLKLFNKFDYEYLNFILNPNVLIPVHGDQRLFKNVVLEELDLKPEHINVDLINDLVDVLLNKSLKMHHVYLLFKPNNQQFIKRHKKILDFNRKLSDEIYKKTKYKDIKKYRDKLITQLLSFYPIDTTLMKLGFKSDSKSKKDLEKLITQIVLESIHSGIDSLKEPLKTIIQPLKTDLKIFYYTTSSFECTDCLSDCDKIIKNVRDNKLKLRNLFFNEIHRLLTCEKTSELANKLKKSGKEPEFPEYQNIQMEKEEYKKNLDSIKNRERHYLIIEYCFKRFLNLPERHKPNFQANQRSKDYAKYLKILDLKEKDVSNVDIFNEINPNDSTSTKEDKESKILKDYSRSKKLTCWNNILQLLHYQKN